MIFESSGIEMPRLPYNHIDGMVNHMKTTFNIDDTVMQQLRVEAARRGTTMTAIVEAGIRHMIANGGVTRDKTKELPPLPTWNGGRALVDISNREELFRIFDEDKPPWS